MASMFGVRFIFITLCAFVDRFAGPDWQKAKTQTEVRFVQISERSININKIYQCLDYLFEIAVKMKLAGLPTVLNA